MSFYKAKSEKERELALSTLRSMEENTMKRSYVLLAIFGGLVVLGGLVNGGHTENTTTAKAEKDAERARKDAEDRRKGFHCLSAWDGSHRGLEQSVKEILRDPDSYQHINTYIEPLKDGTHKVRMNFRAKNGFGGYNTDWAIGTINNTDCSLVTWKMMVR